MHLQTSSHPCGAFRERNNWPRCCATSSGHPCADCNDVSGLRSLRRELSQTTSNVLKLQRRVCRQWRQVWLSWCRPTGPRSRTAQRKKQPCLWRSDDCMLAINLGQTIWSRDTGWGPPKQRDGTLQFFESLLGWRCTLGRCKIQWRWPTELRWIQQTSSFAASSWPPTGIPPAPNNNASNHTSHCPPVSRIPEGPSPGGLHENNDWSPATAPSSKILSWRLFRTEKTSSPQTETQKHQSAQKNGPTCVQQSSPKIGLDGQVLSSPRRSCGITHNTSCQKNPWIASWPSMLARQKQWT